MRRAYSAHACSAQAGSLAATATTRSLGTGRLLLRRGGLRLRSFGLHFLAAPHFFQIVEAAYRRVHHVHDDLAQVDQHPFAAFLDLDSIHLAVVLLHLVAHVDCERLYLARWIAACDDDALG